MRRRERLTGFLIIFVLLTFSAYSNSVNVGGRLPVNPNQQKKESSTNFNNKQTNTSQNIDNQSTINEKSSIIKKTDNEKNSVPKSEKEAKNLSTEQNNLNKNIELRGDNLPTDNRKESEGVFQKKERSHLADRIKVHTVGSGETLWDIAKKHGINIDSLIGANNISNMNSIKPGQKLKILPVKGILYRVSPGESIASIAGKFDISSKTILKDNNIKKESNLKIDQTLILRGAKPEFSYRDRLEKEFMYPIKTRITSKYGPRWGRMHEGIDFAAPMGSPIRAVSSGRVVFSGWVDGYGKVVIIEHQKGLRTLYAHNSKLLVREGEMVGKGEVICRSGNTGNSTGPHLHFEVQVNGRPENPLNYLNK
ncbi:MAG: peptidoglycan DD-metalloendopeptidase family protein [bacterium]